MFSWAIRSSVDLVVLFLKFHCVPCNLFHLQPTPHPCVDFPKLPKPFTVYYCRKRALPSTSTLNVGKSIVALGREGTRSFNAQRWLIHKRAILGLIPIKVCDKAYAYDYHRWHLKGKLLQCTITLLQIYCPSPGTLQQNKKWKLCIWFVKAQTWSGANTRKYVRANPK